MAAWLAAQGIGPGDHVGCYLFNGTEYVETMLAAYKLRAVPINVNYRYVEDELRYLFRDADLKALVHDVEFTPRIEAVRDGLPLLTTTLSVGGDDSDYEHALAASSPERVPVQRSGDDRYIIYTGGTTGHAEGRRVAARGCLLLVLRWRRLQPSQPGEDPGGDARAHRHTRWCSSRSRRSCTAPRNGRCSRG